MKKSSILFFICSFFIHSDMEAQLVYQKKIYELPAPRYSHIYNTERAVDSGYVVSGYSNTTANLAGFIFIAKINELGDTVWTRRYDGPEYEYGYIQNLYDSSYVIYGGLYSFNPCDQQDMFLMKLKANGDTLWTKHYSTCYGDIPRELVKAPNNGYYLFGSLMLGSSSYGSTLLRLDAQGDTVWTKLVDVGGFDKQQNYACVANADGGVLLSGYQKDTSAGAHPYLVKMDSSGNMLWDLYFDAPYTSGIYQIIEVLNGYFIIGGCNLGGTLGSGTMVLKTDLNGTPLWGKMYEKIIIGLKPATLLSDDNIFIPGAKQLGPIIAGQNNTDLVSFKTDSTGNLLWAKKYVTNQLGFGAYSSITSQQANDSGFLITTTSTTDPTYNTYNGLLIKVDSLGNGCNDSTLAINVVDITSMIVTSDTINPVIGYYPVTVGRSPFNYYGGGIKHIDQCNGYVGIEEEKIKKDAILKIYPNPATDQANILINLPKEENKGVIEMYDITGRKLETFIVNSNRTLAVNTANYAEGLYVFLLFINDEPIANVKLSIVK